MSKYIVKNCPACTISPSCCTEYHLKNGHAKDCSDITDCLIKRVLEKCNYAADVYDNEKFYIDDKDICLGESCLAHRILDMFGIEEVKE